jgi:chitodextrinase
MRWVLLALTGCSFAAQAISADDAGLGDPGAPPTPAQLQVAATDCGHVSLSWAASPGATGYAVYRDGAAIATPTPTAFVDDTVAPSTTYRYAVAATDAAGHSAPTPAVTVTTPACTSGAIQFVQSATIQTNGSSVMVSLPGVRAGDLLVGWFLNYQSAVQLSVSDNVNGPWTRGCSEHYDGGATGDVALYYRADSAAGNVTVTVSAAGATYIQTSAAEFAGVAATSPLDRCVVGFGQGNTGSVGPTGTLASPDELVFAGTVNGSPQTTMTAGSGFTLRANDHNDGCEDRIASGTAPQTATLTFTMSPNWNMVVATFLPSP